MQKKRTTLENKEQRTFGGTQAMNYCATGISSKRISITAEPNVYEKRFLFINSLHLSAEAGMANKMHQKS